MLKKFVKMLRLIKKKVLTQYMNGPLALHLQWHEDHPGESYQTRNNCKICGRFNATYFMLKMHMTRMHTDMPKTFQCLQDGCGKAFRVSFIHDCKIEKIHFLSLSISREM